MTVEVATSMHSASSWRWLSPARPSLPQNDTHVGVCSADFFRKLTTTKCTEIISSQISVHFPVQQRGGCFMSTPKFWGPHQVLKPLLLEASCFTAHYIGECCVLLDNINKKDFLLEASNPPRSNWVGVPYGVKSANRFRKRNLLRSLLCRNVCSTCSCKLFRKTLFRKKISTVHIFLLL